MVSSARVKPSIDLLDNKNLETDTISLSEILAAGVRFDASAYNLTARVAREDLRKSGLQILPLFGEGGIATEAHNAFRFRRIFVNQDFGIPFLPSSEINSLRPRIERWLSRRFTKKLSHLLIRPDDVLISCSGSIGNIGLAGPRIAGTALSQDAIRVRFSYATQAGYAAAFLRSRYGRPQLQAGTYGSVIVHIEPEHLSAVLVPTLPNESEVGELFLDAARKRDRANGLIDEAVAQTIRKAGLPEFRVLRTRHANSVSRHISVSDLRGRFEGHFHGALPAAALAETRRIKSVRLVDSGLVREIRAITKFRKRTYVENGGLPLLSSKQLFQIDPIDVKRLAKGAHTKDLPEIALEKNMVAITCSGTIGRVQIIPGYMEGWCANQHATRIIATAPHVAGYLFAWLSSEYGQCLLQRQSYGSVILEIDKDMIGDVPVPILSDEEIEEIGSLVMEANALRTAAWDLETAAITSIEDTIAKATRSSDRAEIAAIG